MGKAGIIINNADAENLNFASEFQWLYGGQDVEKSK